MRVRIDVVVNVGDAVRSVMLSEEPGYVFLHVRENSGDWHVRAAKTSLMADFREDATKYGRAKTRHMPSPWSKVATCAAGAAPGHSVGVVTTPELFQAVVRVHEAALRAQGFGGDAARSYHQADAAGVTA